MVDTKGTYAGPADHRAFRRRRIAQPARCGAPLSHRYPPGQLGPRVSRSSARLQNPINFAGARVRASFSGPDMSMLFPLTGIPIPATPPFAISGDVDYVKPRFRLTNLVGRVGSSDTST